MTPGLERFRDHFRGLESRYLLIGGSATELILDDAGLAFRATKDLDVVLCVEALDDVFVSRFWHFVALAGYQRRESGTRPRRYYRFRRPIDPTYPAMVELFSRRIDAIPIPEGTHLTPLPTGDDLSSLSAILVDDELYEWLLEGRQSPRSTPVTSGSITTTCSACSRSSWPNHASCRRASAVTWRASRRPSGRRARTSGTSDWRSLM